MMLGLIFINALYAFDFMVVSVAMPTITNNLGGQGWYTLGFGVFTLSSLIGIIWSGKIVDARGPYLALKIGFILFLFGLIFAAITPYYWGFILARYCQGIGSGAIITASNALINLFYKNNKRPKVIAIINTAWLIPSLLAPIIGGLIITYIGWRYIFILQVPMVLISAYYILPISKLYIAHQNTNASIFIKNAVKLVIAAILILLGLNEKTLILNIIYVVIGALLIYKPLKLILPDGILTAQIGLPSALLCFALITFIFYISEIFIPLLLIQRYQLNTSIAGLALTSAAITWPLGSTLQVKLIKIKSYRFCGSIGAIGIIVSISLLIFQTLFNWSYELLYVFWGMAGFWLGQTKSFLRAYAMLHTKAGTEGATSSAQGVLDSLTGGLAAGLGGLVYNAGNHYKLFLGYTISIIWTFSVVSALLILIIINFRFRVAYNKT
jgi:MFS family permease